MYSDLLRFLDFTMLTAERLQLDNVSANSTSGAKTSTNFSDKYNINTIFKLGMNHQIILNVIIGLYPGVITVELDNLAAEIAAIAS